MLPLILLFALAAIALGLVYWRNLKVRRSIEALRNSPMPPEWIEVLESRMPVYRRLPPELREKLHGYIQVFVATKSFEPCGGLEEITDEMRVMVAAQACILLLNDRNGNFDRMKSIILYPNAYRASESLFGQPDIGRDDVRLGESWGSGSIVLSWHHTLHGVANPRDGCNVVIHEFAHQLDQIDGAADGLPILGSRKDYPEWQRIFSAAFERHVKRSEAGRRTVMDAYGATNPAEFFAVATETFIEKPKVLHKKYPELYTELARFYALDPKEWEEP